jgi:hypothetical protein
MLSVEPKIMEDAKMNNTGQHWIVMEKILDNFFNQLSEKEHGDKKTKFWKEWDVF